MLLLVRSAGPLWHHRYQHRVQQLTRCAPRPARGPGGIYIYARACGRGCMAPCVLVIMRVKRAALARGLGLPRDWRGGATIGWCQTSKTPADCHQCTARQVPRSRVAARRIPAAAPAWLRLDCLDRQHADDYSCTDGTQAAPTPYTPAVQRSDMLCHVLAWPPEVRTSNTEVTPAT